MSPGRPEKPINWKVVDDLLIAGCSQTEIAGFFEVHRDTLRNRLEAEKGIEYSIYSAEKRTKGESLLRAQQFAKAIGKTKDGDNMMLIWLGKNRLDQTDAPKQDISTNETTIDQTLELSKIKSENRILKEKLSSLGWEEVSNKETVDSIQLLSETDQNESKTRTEYLPGEQTP